MEKANIFRVEFKRLNKITLIIGILYFVLAIINLPFLYDPELGQFSFELSGKPTMALGANLNAYITLGFLPILIGVAFVLFSLITSRSISISINENGQAEYIKKGIPKISKEKKIEFQLKDNLQHISLGSRHQRFVMWVPVAIIFYLIHMVYDYINFLSLGFDLTTYFFTIEYSLKAILIINMIFLIGLNIPHVLFPRKLFRIETTEDTIYFDYTSFTTQKSGTILEKIAFLSVFENIPSDQALVKNDVPEIYPEQLKNQLRLSNFKHFPVFTIILNSILFFLMILPSLIPNFYLGNFSISIEYFLIVAVYYVLAYTLQNKWITDQNIILSDQNKDLMIKREHSVFGTQIMYYSDVDTITQELMPVKPHYLEYVLYFFPLWMVIWVITNIATYFTYFLTQNIYTPIYIIVIIGIFLIPISAHLIPYPMLSIKSKKQSAEVYSIFLPSASIERSPPIKKGFNATYFAKNRRAVLLIIVPVAFGVIWYLLSLFGIWPSVYETIF